MQLYTIVIGVSIIVPCYNSEKTLPRLIGSFLSQKFQGAELILVDDGSIDGTRKSIEAYSRKHKNIILVKQVNRGPAAARNAGVKAAKSAIVLFTDADCVMDKNWIKKMMKPFNDPKVVGVQGRYKVLNGESLLARFVQYEIEERYKRMEKFGAIDFIGSYSAGYRKSIFLKFGGFDEGFKTASGEDPEISYRMADRGLKMAFAPAAVVYHPHPHTLGKYIKTKYGRGYWGRLLYKKHPNMMRGQSYNSVLYFLHIPITYLLLAGLIAALPFNILLSITLFAALLLTAIPSTANIAANEKKFLLIAPFLITARNLAIGAGIAAAMFRRTRNGKSGRF